MASGRGNKHILKLNTCGFKRNVFEGKYLLSQAQYIIYIVNSFWLRILLDKSLQSLWLISDLFHNFIMKRTPNSPKACETSSGPVRAQDGWR